MTINLDILNVPVIGCTIAAKHHTRKKVWICLER
jgi:hypothetical protein